MRITKVAAYAVKSENAYAMSGAVRPGERLPGTDYRRFAPHRQLYSDRSEAALVRVETDEGLVGWGEAQAPIGPEVVLTVVEKVLGPTLLGLDPLATTARAVDMYETLRVRGSGRGLPAGRDRGARHCALGPARPSRWSVDRRAWRWQAARPARPAMSPACARRRRRVAARRLPSGRARASGSSRASDSVCVPTPTRCSDCARPWVMTPGWPSTACGGTPLPAGQDAGAGADRGRRRLL